VGKPLTGSYSLPIVVRLANTRATGLKEGSVVVRGMADGPRTVGDVAMVHPAIMRNPTSIPIGRRILSSEEKERSHACASIQQALLTRHMIETLRQHGKFLPMVYCGDMNVGVAQN
jgi:hypothetical protein